jgi:hypothetical protein
MNPVQIGLNGVAYILTTGTRAAWSGSANANGVYVAAAPGSLSPLNIIRNVVLNIGAKQADVSSRASVWELTRKTLRTADIDFDIPWTPADSNFLLLQASFFLGTSVAIAILDSASTIPGAQGLWADFEVMEFPREEPLDKEMLSKVKIKPTSSAVPPQWVQTPAS